MERVAPAGDVYQAGTLSGNPLAVAAGPRDAGASSTPPPTSASASSPTGSRPASRDAAGDRPVQVASAPGLVTPFFSAGAGARLRRRLGLRPRGLRPLLPGPARARRLPAAVPVRGLVRLARPRRGGDRPHRGGGRGGVRRGARLGCTAAESGTQADSFGQLSPAGRRSELDVGAAVAAADQHQRQHEAERGDHRAAEERRLEALGQRVRERRRAAVAPTPSGRRCASWRSSPARPARARRRSAARC